MEYPRVLMIGIERINANDTSNNGLLLRNLFSSWPRTKLAQIFSYSDNGDNGYFNEYFRIGEKERKFGSVFFKLKKHEIPKLKVDIGATLSEFKKTENSSRIKSIMKQYLIDTGLFEILFPPKISAEMNIWIKNFDPEIIFVQGYCLFYVWLALKLKRKTKAKLAFLATDDWPTYLYSGINGEPRIFKWFISPIVNRSVKQLMSNIDIPFAFHEPMADEYGKRYGKRFITLSHADDPKRFEEALPKRYHANGINSILIAGYFNDFRWPLLLDVNECCRKLNAENIPTRILVISAGMDKKGMDEVANADFIDVIPDPGNDILPQYLKGADINLLIEDFDEKRASALSLSVSSKSHLFMFSQRPTIVYAHPNTGVYRYAQKNGWARVIAERNIDLLCTEIQKLLVDKEDSKTLLKFAKDTYEKYHLKSINKKIFIDAMSVKS